MLLFTLTLLKCCVYITLSSPDPLFHWMPLARLEKNRTRTPLLPEPTAMDMLYEQLKVTWMNTNRCRKTNL